MPSPAEATDVLMLGAGLSGLAAAARLAQGIGLAVVPAEVSLLLDGPTAVFSVCLWLPEPT